MKQIIEDIYFDNYTDAIKIAKEQNRFTPYNLLQLCYYGGKEVNNQYKNLINLPKSQVKEQLLKLGTRVPTYIVSNESDYINSQLLDLKKEKEKIYNKNVDNIKTTSFDFNEPLRFFISVEYGSRVLYSIYNFIRNTLQNMNIDVLYDENSSLELNDDFRRVTKIEEYKPHVIININRLRSHYLNDQQFNFVWFMDPTLILYDDSDLNKREKDYFFYLTDNLKIALESKGISKGKLFWQPFRIGHKDFFIDHEIKKEQKITFIGNNYFETVTPTVKYKENTQLINELSVLFNNMDLNKDTLDNLSEQYYAEGIIRSKEHLELFLFSAIVRVECLKWLVKQSYIKVEIYGSGWDTITELKPYCKGILHGSSEVRRVCNESLYSFVVHPEYKYQQRLLEASACGSVPIVYNDQTCVEKFSHDDNIVPFKDKNELYDILKQIKMPKKVSTQISEDMNYTDLIYDIQNIIKQVQQNVR